ncbi:Uncharacterised protein [Mycobacteroides abscessus]|nr:Uncharacterised protein [Mycobacteroides abscessus]
MVSLRWSTSTCSGAIPDSRTTSSVRRVPDSLSRCGVCTSTGSAASRAIWSWREKTSSSSGVIESYPTSPTATTPSLSR